MKRICVLLISLSVAGFMSACQGGSKGVTLNTSATLLVGKWSLQQQKSVQYLDGVIKVDTAFTPSFLISGGHLQFNKDGSYNSSGYSATGVNTSGDLSTGIPSVGRDSTYGTYSLESSVLKLTSSIAGIGTVSVSFFSTAPLPVFTPVSYSAQINQLTSSSLTIHTEYIATVTQNGMAHSYKDDEDYSYSK